MVGLNGGFHTDRKRLGRLFGDLRIPETVLPVESRKVGEDDGANGATGGEVRKRLNKEVIRQGCQSSEEGG